jgi:hypothetical protein
MIPRIEKENWLKVFENGIFGEICGPKKEAVTEVWKKRIMLRRFMIFICTPYEIWLLLGLSNTEAEVGSLVERMQKI